jgi:hypothetical protein
VNLLTPRKNPACTPEQLTARSATKIALARRAVSALTDARRSLSARSPACTNTPDEHFLIDRHRAFAGVIVSPCSGHGSSSVGDWRNCGGLVERGTSRHKIELFGSKRLETSSLCRRHAAGKPTSDRQNDAKPQPASAQTRFGAIGRCRIGVASTISDETVEPPVFRWL